MKVFTDFALIPLKIKCYSILQKRLSRMLDISNCDIIYNVIYVICKPPFRLAQLKYIDSYNCSSLRYIAGWINFMIYRYMVAEYF